MSAKHPALLVPIWLLRAGEHLVRYPYGLTVDVAQTAVALLVGTRPMTAKRCCWPMLVPFAGAVWIAPDRPLAESARAAYACAPARRMLAVVSRFYAGPERRAVHRWHWSNHCPGCPLLFELEPLGMMFALVAELSLDRDLDLRDRLHARPQRGESDAVSVRCSLSPSRSTLGIAFAGNMFTLFRIYELADAVHLSPGDARRTPTRPAAAAAYTSAS